MRLFLASDVHGNRAAIRELPHRARAQGANVVVLAGDVSHRGRPRSFIEDLVAAFAPLPVVAVPGNLDPLEVHDAFEQAGARSVHGRRASVVDLGFAGMGGATPHFLGGPYQVDESAIARGLAVAERGDVLVLHCPPHGTLDRTHLGIRAGSRAAAEAVARLAPPLVLCGHVHEARGVLVQGETLIVNAGAGKHLRSALVERTEAGWRATLHG